MRNKVTFKLLNDNAEVKSPKEKSVVEEEERKKVQNFQGLLFERPFFEICSFTLF